MTHPAVTITNTFNTRHQSRYDHDIMTGTRNGEISFAGVGSIKFDTSLRTRQNAGLLHDLLQEVEQQCTAQPKKTKGTIRRPNWGNGKVYRWRLGVVKGLTPVIHVTLFGEATKGRLREIHFALLKLAA